MDKQKSQLEIILFGDSPNSDVLKNVIQHTDVKTIFHFGEENISIPKIKIENISQASFRNFLNTRKKLDIYINDYGTRERNYFWENLNYLKSDIGEGSNIFHPSALIDRVKVDLGGVICSGYPGSGNMVLQSVLTHITGLTQRQNELDKHAYLRDISLSYLNSVITYIEANLFRYGLSRIDVSPTFQNNTSLFCYFGENQRHELALNNIKLNSFAWSTFWSGTHEPPNTANLNFYKNLGLQFLCMIRNPLDILVSLAAKQTAWMGFRHPEVLLANRSWVNTTVASLAYYFKCIVDNSNAIDIVRYEDVISNLAGFVAHIASITHNNITKDNVAYIVDKIHGQSLTHDRGHFWKPGVDKWRQYLPPSAIETISKSNLLEFARELGYVSEMSKVGFDSSDSLPTFFDSSEFSFEECRLEQICGKEYSCDISSKVIQYDCGDSTLVCYNKYADAAGHLAQDPFFQALLKSGGIAKTFKGDEAFGRELKTMNNLYNRAFV